MNWVVVVFCLIIGEVNLEDFLLSRCSPHTHCVVIATRFPPDHQDRSPQPGSHPHLCYSFSGTGHPECPGGGLNFPFSGVIVGPLGKEFLSLELRPLDPQSLRIVTGMRSNILLMDHWRER